jgi:predicted Fe-Mo cluster-binding NifX family protein
MLDRLAVPVADGRFCEHFGRAAEFLLCDVEVGSLAPGRMRHVVRKTRPGQCESVPTWLKSMCVTTVLAGGIGGVALHRLKANGIQVVPGLRGDDPAAVLNDWLKHRQSDGENRCKLEHHRMRHCRAPIGKRR